LNADELLKVCAVIGRKWTPAVITTLAERPVRRGELFRRLSGIHCKVLQQSLNGLIRDGMVVKSCGLDEINRVQSVYGLTELGESLLSVFELMQIWCSDHLSEVLEAQQHADGGEEHCEPKNPALSEG